MFRIRAIFLLIFILLTTSNFSSSDGALFKPCLIDLEENYMCTMKNLNLTTDIFEFETLVLPQNTKIRITDSKIPKLGNGMCKPPISFLTKSSIEELQLSELSIEEVVHYAFHRCNMLKYLNLRDNKIEILDKSVFSLTVKLEHIDLTNNLLQKLHMKLFAGLRSLRELYLSGNYLTTFSPELLNTCPVLEDLKLASNDLFDLNLKKILENSPRLRDVAFNDNQMRCERVRNIIGFMKENSVWANHYYEGKGRDRIMPTESVESTRCLGDIPWATVHYIYVHTKSVEEK